MPLSDTLPGSARPARTGPAPSRWIAGGPRCHGTPRIRVFCFPHAGGGSALYRPWRAPLAEAGIDVCPVVLPGREGRIRERPHDSVHTLMDALCEGLRDQLDVPYAFFGHSMGSVVAYEAARRFRREGLGGGPRYVVVSGRRAAQLPTRRRLFSDLPDEELLADIAQLNGTPAEILHDRELMRLFLPSLRADFALNECYAPLPGPPLDVPLTALGGLADPEVDPDELRAWGECTTGPFRALLFEGDHFYLKGARNEVLAEIRTALGGG
jgi:medium-chain acyl-[acyl-carrier-protein] hydrolase